jgi:hypothetical protein
MSSYDLSDNDVSNTIVDTESVEIWYLNPNLLLSDVNELFPLEHMEFNRKINALTRLVILVTVILFLLGGGVKYIVSGILSLLFIYFYSLYCNKEGFHNDIVTYDQLESTDIFQPPTSSNPFSNLLVSDIKYNPDKKPAMPAYNSDVEEQINNSVKESIQNIYPDIPDINDKLFKNLGEEMEFEQSMRQFISNPSTTLPNDQTAFAQFCYGNMLSCKDGDSSVCGQIGQNYTNL